MLIVQSNSTDVYRNLAMEEYLMEHAVDCGPVLFLWQSDCAVVMGKNQNPWRECRLELMCGEGVPLARRISGGGTVYHDAGNLNYCVIVGRTRYREEQAYEMVFRALEGLGVHAERTGTSNLSVGGLKFSGNAFCFRKGRALHHGTLLLHSDLERLKRYLGSMFERIETHAIASVPARVANLGLDVAQVSAALCDSFKAFYGDGRDCQRVEDGLDGFLQPLVERHGSADWLYGATPRFSLNHGAMRLAIVKGRVSAAEGAGSARYLDARFSDMAFSLLSNVD